MHAHNPKTSVTIGNHKGLGTCACLLLAPTCRLWTVQHRNHDIKFMTRRVPQDQRHMALANKWPLRLRMRAVVLQGADVDATDATTRKQGGFCIARHDAVRDALG